MMTTFMVDSVARNGYLALPASGTGRGVLVLHAWWGLTNFFKTTCDRLAAEGFVAFAPDLYQGQIAATIDEAKQLNQMMEENNFPEMKATADAALHFLQTDPAVQGGQVGAVGFSMGAYFALLLDESHVDSLAGIVLFYGVGGADLSSSKAQFQGHYGDTDEWEPIEQVKEMTAVNAEIHIYPHTGHWFFESNKPEHYNADAAALAWQRTVAFLDKTLPSGEQ